MALRSSIREALDHKTLSDVEMFEQMIFDLVHGSGGGVGSLAGRMGYVGKAGSESLQNEVCATNSRFKFGALELFVALVKVPVRDRERFLNSLDSLLGREAVCSVSYESVMGELAALGKEQNDVNTAVFKSLEGDNHLDQRERVAISKELDDVIDRANSTKASLLQGDELHGSE